MQKTSAESVAKMAAAPDIWAQINFWQIWQTLKLACLTTYEAASLWVQTVWLIVWPILQLCALILEALLPQVQTAAGYGWRFLLRQNPFVLFGIACLLVLIIYVWRMGYIYRTRVRISDFNRRVRLEYKLFVDNVKSKSRFAGLVLGNIVPHVFFWGLVVFLFRRYPNLLHAVDQDNVLVHATLVFYPIISSVWTIRVHRRREEAVMEFDKRPHSRSASSFCQTPGATIRRRTPSTLLGTRPLSPSSRLSRSSESFHRKSPSFLVASSASSSSLSVPESPPRRSLSPPTAEPDEKSPLPPLNIPDVRESGSVRTPSGARSPSLLTPDAAGTPRRRLSGSISEVGTGAGPVVLNRIMYPSPRYRLRSDMSEFDLPDSPVGGESEDVVRKYYQNALRSMFQRLTYWVVLSWFFFLLPIITFFIPSSLMDRIRVPGVMLVIIAIWLQLPWTDGSELAFRLLAPLISPYLGVADSAEQQIAKATLERSNLLVGALRFARVITDEQADMFTQTIQHSGYLLIGLVFLFTPGVITRLGALFVGFGVPVFTVSGVIINRRQSVCREWLTYFVVLYVFEHVHTALSVAFSWVPFWYHAKLVLLMWLQLPVFRGAQRIYDRVADFLDYVKPDGKPARRVTAVQPIVTGTAPSASVSASSSSSQLPPTSQSTPAPTSQDAGVQ